MTVQSARAVLDRAASVANIAMLRANDLPSHIQLEKIKELTALLSFEIDNLPPDDVYTSETRNLILAQLDVHRSILAPIRRLPVELLSEIFFQAAYELSLRTLQVSVTIARVCGLWREVAHGRRGLWARVVVRSLRDLEQYLELFLPLAKDNLLELRCDTYKVLKNMWDRIAPYASRWRSITIEGQLCTLPDLKVLYMENLERLIVDAYDAPISLDLSALDFVVAPRLRHIALTLDALQSERQLHVPVARTLTSLEVTAESPYCVTLILPLLQACAYTLQSLTIRIRQVSDGADASYSRTPDILVLQALTYLSLADSACALMNCVTTPLVQQLVLSNVPAYGSRFLWEFLTRGHASQSLLVLRVYKAEEREMSVWIPSLRLLDNLLQLHFDELLSNGDFLEKLILHPNWPPLLPLLQGIAVSHIYDDHVELREIISDVCLSREKEIVHRGRQAWVLLHWLPYPYDVDSHY